MDTAAIAVRQQRDAIFALYNAYASMPGAAKAVTDNRDLIGQKLFPVDAANKPIKPDQIPVADYKKALADVKTAVGG